MKRLNRTVLICLLVVLAGCSTTTFLYNRADFIIPWVLRDYVSLHGEQKELLDTLLGPLLEWHRMQELPRYIELIEQMESALDRPLTREALQELVVDFEQAWARLESRSVELMLALGDTLEDQQVEDFLQRLDKQQAKFEKKYLRRDDQEYLEDNSDNFRDVFRDYLGRLDSMQRERLQQAAADMKRADVPWLSERARWNLLLREILQRQPGWQQQLWDAMAARPETVSEAYMEVYLHNTEVIQLAVIDVLNSRSAEQDERLRRKLRNYREDFQTLVEQGRERNLK